MAEMRCYLALIIMLLLLFPLDDATQAQVDPSTVVIRFFAAINERSVVELLSTVDAELAKGTKRFILLISSPGGTVYHGLAAYNYLKGIPAEVITHNFGSADS